MIFSCRHNINSQVVFHQSFHFILYSSFQFLIARRLKCFELAKAYTIFILWRWSMPQDKMTRPCVDNMQNGETWIILSVFSTPHRYSISHECNKNKSNGVNRWRLCDSSTLNWLMQRKVYLFSSYRLIPESILSHRIRIKFHNKLCDQRFANVLQCNVRRWITDVESSWNKYVLLFMASRMRAMYLVISTSTAFD